MSHLDQYKHQISKPYSSSKYDCTFRIVMNQSLIHEMQLDKVRSHADPNVMEVFYSDQIHRTPPPNKTVETALPREMSAQEKSIQDWKEALVDRPTLETIDAVVTEFAKSKEYVAKDIDQTVNYYPPNKFHVLKEYVAIHVAGKADIMKPSLINKQQCDPTLFKSIFTVGDGTCFVHSILLSISGAYRKYTDEQKGFIGRDIRSKLNLPGKSADFLGDEVLDKMAALFDICILYFATLFIDTYSCRMVGDKSKKCIMMINVNDGHYMAVTYDGKFILDEVDVGCDFGVVD
jgi:hypothetical protein